jgi:hypothetical protein
MMRRIITTNVNPPIPLRAYDWMAHFEGDEEYDFVTAGGQVSNTVPGRHNQVAQLVRELPITRKVRAPSISAGSLIR